ncbi:MAG: Fic family protein [Patescibacteria group bacterium]|nr:Fic family protein [Patescibacteria group bacterium]
MFLCILRAILARIVRQELAAIHPFFDGNRRTTRVLATLILYQRGYDFRRLFALKD